MPKRPLPEALLTLLEAHGMSYAPHYSPAALSDHGPMAYLALHGLGVGELRIGRFATDYQKRLGSLERSSERLGTDDWRRHVGRPDSYGALLEFFAGQIRVRGFRATLARYLPALASGWVLDLYHPLIRLAYAIEFGVPSEMAAGLAYLASLGDDPRLMLAGRRPPLALGGREYLEALQARRNAAAVDGPASFNERYRLVVQSTELGPAGGTPEAVVRELSRACLEVFHATHDFFALHLVTASHAFGVCTPWLGPHAAGLFSVGIGAAYLALGAPSFAPLTPSTGSLPLEKLAEATDEHEIKLAYACRALGQAASDPTYEWVAEQYLARRSSDNRSL